MSRNHFGPPFSGSEERRGYHHGNLKEALIRAALSLISTRGPEGFTLAEAARLAGVSSAAPYRHFKDREHLMAEVAREGFSRFAGRLEKAWDEGRPEPRAALDRLGRAYLAFARDEPALYTAMFEAGVSTGADPELQRISDAAFAVLRQACEAVHATLPADRRAPALMMALHIWSMSHGIAALFGRADGGRRPLPVPPEDLLEAGILIYLSGLGGEPASKST